jgi:glucose/arabinose dehydrogenase
VGQACILRRVKAAIASLVAVTALSAAAAAVAWAGGPTSRPPGAPNAGSAAAKVRLVRVGRFSRPTYLTAPKGDTERQFVVEQRGVIRVIRKGKKLGRPFLSLRKRVGCCGEAGMLSMAFAPDYARSRRFYVYYSDRSGTIEVDEFKRSAKSEDRAVPSSRRVVLRQRHTTRNHKGGQLQFGGDGMLYLGLGDGGPQKDPAQRGQKLSTLLGKILRIDPRHGRRYRVPRNNPFVGRKGARPEIWAYGVRNPWRFSFTRQGSFVLGDVGQGKVEELDYLVGHRGRPPRGGANFGWSIFEGRSRFRPGTAPGHVKPILQRRHRSGSGGPCGIIGGYVVRDRSLKGLVGRYVYGDFCDGGLRVVRLRKGRALGDRALGPKVTGTSSFGQDARGRLYVTSVLGPVYRLVRRR